MAMRIIGYILLIIGGIALIYGLIIYYTSLKDVKWMESQIPTARKAFEEAKGTNTEEAARLELQALQTEILEKKPAAEKKRVVSKWWLLGGGVLILPGLVFVLFGKRRRRTTSKSSNRFWA